MEDAGKNDGAAAGLGPADQQEIVEAVEPTGESVVDVPDQAAIGIVVELPGRPDADAIDIVVPAVAVEEPSAIQDPTAAAAGEAVEAPAEAQQEAVEPAPGTVEGPGITEQGAAGEAGIDITLPGSGDAVAADLANGPVDQAADVAVEPPATGGAEPAVEGPSEPVETTAAAAA